MTTEQILDRLAGIIRDITEFYGELSQELTNLRVVVDNTRVYSDVKKTPTERFYSFRGRLRRLNKEKTRKGKQLYISQKRSLIICLMFLNNN